MLRFILSYAFFEIVIVGVALLFTVWHAYRRRHPKPWTPPPGFQKTDEVFVDPTTGNRQRVWYNAQTGERSYEVFQGPRTPQG